MFPKLYKKNIHYRALLLLVPVVLGILLYYASAMQRPLVLLLFGSWLYHINRRTHFYTKPLVYSLLLSGLYMGAAYYLSAREAYRISQSFLGQCHEGASYVLRIKEPPKETPKTQKYLAEVLAVKDSVGVEHESKGACLVYVPKELSRLRVGDIISCNGTMLPIPSPKNPYEFDYKSYAQSRSIYGSLFASRSKISKLGHVKSGGLHVIKNWLTEHIALTAERYLADTSKPLFIALTQGDKSSMSAETKQSFARSGVLHLIALSGFHVIIVWYFILYPLFILRHKKSREITAIVLLWLYAYLMGGTPSIVRAVAVISLWKASGLIGRKRESINLIFFIAVLLLLIKPSWLRDVGFQLSFMATLSIVFFYEPISTRLQSPYKWINFLGSLLAVSLAAQILSLPFSLHYFHQFPATFLVSNVVGSLIVTLLVPLNFLLLIFSKIPIVASALAWSIDRLSELFYTLTDRLAQLQPQLLSQVFLDGWAALFLFLFILSLVVWLYHKNKWQYLVTAVLLLLLGSYSLHQQWHRRSQSSLVVQHLSKASSVIIKKDKTVSWIHSDSLSSYDYEGRVLPYFIAHYIHPQELVSDTLSDDQNTLIDLGDKKMVLYSGSSSRALTDNCDVLVLRKSTRMPLTKILSEYNPGVIIADGSVPFYQIDKWKTEAMQTGVSLYCTQDSGAYVLDLD